MISLGKHLFKSFHYLNRLLYYFSVVINRKIYKGKISFKREGGTILATRRHFIRTGAAALAGTIPLARGLESVVDAELAQAPSKRITFEEALADLRLRQPYIRQIFVEEFGEAGYQNADEIIYDHDRKLAMESARLQADLIFQDPKQVKNLIGIIARGANVDPSKFPGIDLVQLREMSLNSAYSNIYNSSAQTRPPIPSYGNGRKSTIFIFNGLFNVLDLKSGGYDKVFVPSEDIIRATLRHEFQHAKNFFDGIRMPNGFRIDEKNFFEIHPAVVGFLDELSCYESEIAWVNKFGQNNDAYLHTLWNLAGRDYTWTEDPRRKLTRYNLTEREKELVQSGRDRVNQLYKNHPQAAKFYQFIKQKMEEIRPKV